MTFFLPKNYKINPDPIYFEDKTDKIFQPHVYELAFFIKQRNPSIKYIIDIGCGSGEKLNIFTNDIHKIGIDIGTNLQLFKKNNPSNSSCIEINLEKGFPSINDKIIESSIVICANVIEHLNDPSILIKNLSIISKKAPILLVSIPTEI